jgi:DNA (cytosine-5)-methyltransferase 1
MKVLEMNALVEFQDSVQNELFVKTDLPERHVCFPAPTRPAFTFIDLFAGIGGFRIPLQNLQGRCVFSSEFNEHAQQSYLLNFGELPHGDITKIPSESVPEHDVLTAGFPCQPFSISGKMKGFEGTRGTLIYEVFRIIEARQPKVVLLENVKHLMHHGKGETFKTILHHLESLGYFVSWKLLNASDFGVPQNRERIIIVGAKKQAFDFSKVQTQDKPVLKDFLETDVPFEYLDEPYTLIEQPKTQESGLIFIGYRNKNIRIAGVRANTEHLSRVHKQPNRIYSSEGVHPALPSQETSGRFWIYHEKKVRKLTINECYRLMGFPEQFKKINNLSALYKQVGNSVCVPMVQSVCEQIKEQLL